MKKLERRSRICLVLAAAVAVGMAVFFLRWLGSGERWASAPFNRHLYDATGMLMSGTVLDRDGDVLSAVEEGKRTYYPNEIVRKATLHAVGDRFIGTGALTAFAHELTGFDIINGAYGAQRGNELYLTLDARYNYEAYQALGGKRGTVAVYNYKTGEILCMVSAPSYDPLRVPEGIETDPRYEGAFLNRFLSSTFTPGSVYKTVTLAAALEELSDLEGREWTCSGSVTIDGEVITCAGVHGSQTTKEAFAHSCNVAFAQMAVEVGAEALQRETERAGLTGSYSVDGITTAKGSFAWAEMTDGALAWSGVGQDKNQVNPCAMMVYMGAIANGGKAANPRLIAKTVGALGLPSLPRPTTKTDRLISTSGAEVLREWMAYNVEATYGKDRFPGMNLCAKSGTAEVGQDKAPHAWFAGFLEGDETPYAFVVLVENGGGGSTVAGNVAAKVLDIMVHGY